MAYAAISYQAYSFKPPEFTEAEIKNIASIPFDEFRKNLNSQLASERSQFKSEYPIFRRVLTVSATLLVLAAIGMGISAYCLINNISTGAIWNNLCFWTL